MSHSCTFVLLPFLYRAGWSSLPLQSSSEDSHGVPHAEHARALVVHHVLAEVHVRLIPDRDAQLLARPVRSWVVVGS